ncbi:MAG: DUF1249 domain-containing protein [Candidatus Competibacteraceae bacterium]|nr:DUF1249 domain-containing protein [Candidatus Competibacteraceae bacterium]
MILLRHPPAEIIAHDTPGAFSALMDLYERNYINLRRLLPVMPPASTARISRVPESLDLHLRVIERCRYTSELILTYEFGRDQKAVSAEPNLRIRIYHDARLAEVLAAHPRRHPTFSTDRFSNPAQIEIPPLLARWRINRFLFKWLTYCLRQGHRFTEHSGGSL